MKNNNIITITYNQKNILEAILILNDYDVKEHIYTTKEIYLEQAMQGDNVINIITNKLDDVKSIINFLDTSRSDDPDLIVDLYNIIFEFAKTINAFLIHYNTMTIINNDMSTLYTLTSGIEQ